MPACAHRGSSQRSDKLSTCGLCMHFNKRKAIHAKDRVHNRACTPLWRMKQDHLFTTAAESASARNRQRDGVQGYDKRSMRGLCMCFENVQSKAIHAKKSACKKACMYALMAYKEDLSAQLQNALVCKANGHFSELQQAIEARSSQALRTASKPRDLTNKPRSKPCIDALVAFRTS